MKDRLYPKDHPISQHYYLVIMSFRILEIYFPNDISKIKFPKEQKSSCGCPSLCHGYRPDPDAAHFILELETMLGLAMIQKRAWNLFTI